MTAGDFRAALSRHRPQIAVVLGSGLGSLIPPGEIIARLAFAEAGLPATSVHGHPGEFRLVSHRGHASIHQCGRLHGYEGHSPEVVVAPVGLLAEWGVRHLLLTNAAGGIHPALVPGTLMALAGHFSLRAPADWLGAVARLDRPFPCDSVYDVAGNDLLASIERAAGRPLLRGTYTAVTGPCYETPAEIRALRQLGADAVGMSTAPEAAAARRLGLRVNALSCVTNRAAGLSDRPLDHAEVMAAAAGIAARMLGLVGEFARRVG